MKKGFKKIILGTMLAAFSIAPLTGCSIFGEDGYTITDIQTRFDASTGNVIVMISTTSEENPLITFTIPQGDDGVGIENISSDISEDGNSVVITITYVENRLAPTIITVPIVNGKDGKGITNMDVNYDENGNLVMIVRYTDGTTQGPFTIPRGIDGDDGVGIESTEVDYKSDKNNVILIIHYTDPTMEDTVINIPKGVGVESIDYMPNLSTEDEYVLQVTYSDGYVDYIFLDRPKTTVWHKGETAPDSSIGKEGDFYLNIVNGHVYQKNGGVWSFLFSMKGTGSAISYVVQFIPEKGTWEDGSNYSIGMSVEYGKYIDLKNIPTPIRENYVFDGWWTTNDDNPNAGQFTDLTPVLKDITLYPRWVEEV